MQDRPEIIKPLGVSRTDVFFDQQFLTNARESVESVVPQVRGKRVLLYAPTFRGRVASAEGPDQLDIAGLKAAVGGDFVLLIKHHPFVKQLPPIPCLLYTSHDHHTDALVDERHGQLLGKHLRRARPLVVADVGIAHGKIRGTHHHARRCIQLQLNRDVYKRQLYG